MSNYSSQEFDSPSLLKLRQTITSSGPVTVPNGIKKVWAVVIGGGGGGGNNSNYVTAPTIVSGIAGGSITSVSSNSPMTGYATYYTTSYVPVGATISITGFTPTSYNVTATVTHSNPGVSFSVPSAGSGTVTVNGVFTNILYFTCNSAPYSIGDRITFAGQVPTTFTGTLYVSAISGNTIICNKTSSAPAANTALTTVGTVRLAYHGGGGGGGAGGFSCGWTYPTNTCIVGDGGTGETALNNATAGGYSSYGTIIAGGGGPGRSDRFNNNTSSGGILGGGGGGVNGTSVSSTENSFTGAPNVGGKSVSGNNTVGTSAVSGGGSSGTVISTGVEVTTNLTINGGGSGLIGGGSGGGSTTGTVTAGNGGNGYQSTGGNGASGTGYSFGGGGGGAGYLNNGGNASGPNGGNGGLGGGGGGGAAGMNNGGNGGKGIIYLYY